MLRFTPPHSAGEHDVTTETAVRAATINAWMTETAGAVRAQRDYLTQLDAAIGDGDHGTNMDRGFAAVEKALAGQNGDLPPGRLLIVAGKTLVSTVGGASGPLWGSALRAAGRSPPWSTSVPPHRATRRWSMRSCPRWKRCGARWIPICRWPWRSPPPAKRPRKARGQPCRCWHVRGVPPISASARSVTRIPAR